LRIAGKERWSGGERIEHGSDGSDRSDRSDFKIGTGNKRKATGTGRRHEAPEEGNRHEALGNRGRKKEEERRSNR